MDEGGCTDESCAMDKGHNVDKGGCTDEGHAMDEGHAGDAVDEGCTRNAVDKGCTRDAVEGCDMVCSHSKVKSQPSQTAGESDHQNVHIYNAPQSTECLLSFIGNRCKCVDSVRLCHDVARAEAMHVWLIETSSNTDIVVAVIDFGLLGRQAEEAHHGVRLQGFGKKAEACKTRLAFGV